MHNITIYGSGCMRCHALTEKTKQAIDVLGEDITLSMETDPQRMAAVGVLSTPALALDGKVLLSGKVPNAAELRDLLMKALARKAVSHQQDSCCGGDKKESDAECSCGSKTTEKERERGCACGSCCGSAKGGGGLKTLLVILVLCLLAFVGIRQMEKNTAMENASTAESPATSAEEPVKNGIVLDFFTFGKRCATCVRMETWAREAVETEFSDALRSGQLVLRSLDGTPATVQKYGLTSKSLVLRRVQDGKETTWLNLDRIWELSGDEGAYKAYIIEYIKREL